MDLRERVTDAREALERLVGAIPGYRGYKEKELRREADKLLRMHLARRFEEERRRLTRVQSSLTEAGELKAVVALERAMMRLQLLIDRLKTAAYGHAGLFDAVKVKQEELDALYNYDYSLTQGLAQVSEKVGKLAGATEEGVIIAAADYLVGVLEGINDTFSRRQDVILGLVEPPSASEG